MKLSPENYHSPEASWHYLSASQYKNFAGTLGQKGCEARAMAELRGEWRQETTTALLVGSYVDAYFEGTLDAFKVANPEMFLKDMVTLKAPFLRANEVIARIERDPFFMACLKGEKQVIFTAEMFGTPWKIKIDALEREHRGGYITDLKVMEALTKHFWVKDIGKMSFIQFWGYDLAAAIYQRVTEINIKKRLPFLIAAASKEPVVDIEVLGFDQRIDLDTAIMEVEKNVPRILQVKAGKVDPDKCGQCDYCKSTKVLTTVIHFSELLEKV